MFCFFFFMFGSWPELMNFLNGLLSASKMLEKEFKPKTSWASSWDVFDGRDKFLVSDPTTAIGGMSLYRKQCTVPCNTKIWTHIMFRYLLNQRLVFTQTNSWHDTVDFYLRYSTIRLVSYNPTPLWRQRRLDVTSLIGYQPVVAPGSDIVVQ